MKHSFAFTLFVCGILTLTHAASVGKPTCGGSSSSKNIQLLTPANPPRECRYNIKAYSSYVCQLRIDFAMTLAQPTLTTNLATGQITAECTEDQFQVYGLNLCGKETNQHIYVPFNRSNGVTNVPLVLSLANRVDITSLPTPSWDIRITQLECPAGASVRSEIDVGAMGIEARAAIKDGFFVAPTGCLQYFPDTSGTLTSFNYNNGQGIYPSNLNYAICFRRRTANTALDLRSNHWRLSANNSQTLQTDSKCYSSSASVNSGDYLLVPQATLLQDNQRATYFCGSSSKDISIRSTNPGPLLAIFNSGTSSRQTQAGFSLTYSAW